MARFRMPRLPKKENGPLISTVEQPDRMSCTTRAQGGLVLMLQPWATG
ncbi:MAG: hypothetical protein AAGL96_08905 [Pseudomonadota bacterium]